MPKTKLNEKSDEKQIDSFVTENKGENNFVKSESSAIEHKFYELSGNKKLRKISLALRQILLFAPGAILLWVMSWAITEGVLTSNSIPLWAYPVFVLSFFTTTLGLSDVRKPKNFLISGSSVLFGIFFGVASGVFTDFLRIFVNFIGNVSS